MHIIEHGERMDVALVLRRHPGGTTYQEANWYWVTVGRRPDIIVDGPFHTKRDAQRFRQASIQPR